MPYRQLSNFILNAPSLACSRRIHQKDDTDRTTFERLNNIEREVNLIQFDLRAIKEEAYREAIHATTNGNVSARKIARPFQKLVTLQVDKNKRDKNLRDRLLKEKRLETTRSVRREEFLNRAMRPRKLSDVAQKQRRNKKSMSSAFMQFMRPISSAFTSDTLHVPGPKRSPAELDFIPSGKPSLVINLVEARVAQFINNERSFTFQLDTEDGGRYLLQAVDKREMSKWIDTINHVANMAAKRRLTYIGNSPKPQPSDHIYTHSMTASRDPVAGSFDLSLQGLTTHII
jgi:GTPase-activating protein BEM2